MTVQIHPTREQIANWIEKYVPEKDLFFLREEDLPTFEKYLHYALVIPRDEYGSHSSYTQIQLTNSYESYRISMDAQYVIVAQSDWVTNLAPQDKEVLFRIQIIVGRGLVFPLSVFPDHDVLPTEHIVKEKGERYVILQKDMWKGLPYASKEQAIQAYALEWDNWTSLEAPVKTPAHLKKYANTFAMESGANCLAATLYAISGYPEQREWVVHEWVHQKTFIEGLRTAFYVTTNDELQEGDVVTWVNEEGVIQHAAYHIGDQKFFNKNGQTFFNPWKIIEWDDLKEEWNRFNVCIYRKSYH